MSSIDHTAWAPLRPILEGAFTPNGQDQSIAVWRGLYDVPAGTVLHRGCRARDEEAALALLVEARFWTIDAVYAGEYARTCPDPALRFLPGFMLEARLARSATFANMSPYPLAEALFFSPRRYQVSASSAQELQRRHSTAIAVAFAGRDLDGVWDHDGREVLLPQSPTLLTNATIRRLYEPSTK